MLSNLSKEIKIGGTYQHYKGETYKVLNLAVYSEDINKTFVIYETKSYENPVAKVWARPIEMFLETIEINGNIVPRFKLIS